MPEPRNIITEAHVAAIETVAESWNNETLTDPIEDRTIETGEWVVYTVEEDGDHYAHYLDFSAVPDEYREEISGGVASDLANKGFLFNAVDRNRAHVMHRTWADRRFPKAAAP